MPNPRGFISVQRIENGYRPVQERIRDSKEVEAQLSDAERKLQASRCMDCGVPFCSWSCPVANVMPEWQDKILQGDWRAGYEILQQTANFPEFTGRLCPALCESACVLGINDTPVAIRENELAASEKAFHDGQFHPRAPTWLTGQTGSVVALGPPGTCRWA